MRRAMTSPKRVLLFSIALLTALALGAPSGALAGTGLDASSPAVQPDVVLVAQWKGIKIPKLPKPPEVKAVPNVTGKPQADAERRLKGAGFKSVVRRVPTRDPAQVGKVKTQRPPAGQKHLLIMPVGLEVWELERLRRGRPGGLTEAGGDPRPTGNVKVPNLVGKHINAAGQDLLRAGLKPIAGKPVITNKSGLDKKVESQSPGANRTVPAGTRVTMNVYQFKAEVQVPPVRGMPVKDAVDRLRKASLKSKVFDIATEDSNKHGIVGAQAPIAGKMVPPGTEVRLGAWWHQAGSGRPSKVNTPGVIGMPKERAVRALTDAGFGSSVKLVLTGTKDRAGRVKAQAPSPGTPVNLGTTVALDVWEFREGVLDLGPTLTVTGVPNVIGMTKENAKKALKEKGFTNVVVEDKYANWGRIGSRLPPAPLVDAQNPAAGSSHYTHERLLLTLLNYVAHHERVKLPNVTRLKLEEAIEKLRENRLLYKVTWINTTRQRQDGIVALQYPRPSGSATGQARPGEVVNLTVSKYDPQVVVPSVVGMHLKEAAEKLKAAGLPNYSLRPGKYNKNPGVVVRQSKAPGMSEYPWRTITLDIQEAVIRLPSQNEVNGWTVEKVKSYLWDQGWRGTFKIKQYIDSWALTNDRTLVGKVRNYLGQPDGGRIPYNQELGIVVWRSFTTIVPNMKNETWKFAKETLVRLHLRPHIEKYAIIDDKNKECRVKETSPSAGRQAKTGSTVNLTVWRHKAGGGKLGGSRISLFKVTATNLKPCPGEW